MWVEELFLEHVQVLERLQFVQLKECYQMGMEKNNCKKNWEIPQQSRGMFHSFTSAKAFTFSLALMLAVDIMHHRYGSCKTSQAELF